MRISILVNKNSWIVPYAEQLLNLLKKKHTVELYWEHENIPEGECLIILSYERIVPKEILLKNKNNLVVHESALPRGKGWSPLSWQILEDKNNIPITLFEATEEIDSGNIYLQDEIKYEGHELVEELRAKQGEKTIELILEFFKNYSNLQSRKQKGKETFYSRRQPEDSELNISKSLKSQFNKLRIVDNERYPAFFQYKGHKYILKIYKEK